MFDGTQQSKLSNAINSLAAYDENTWAKGHFYA